MKTLDGIIQGSDQWIEIRRQYNPASLAPVMMGASKHTKRSELARMLTTGEEKEFSKWFRDNILEAGHEIEANARPIAEAIIEEDLYPVTGVHDEHPLLASFDGLTMLGDTVWECKSWNEAKAAKVREGEIPEEDLWQVIQQLVVSGAQKAMYMVTDGTEEKAVHCWYTLQDGDEEMLLAHWKQFNEDVANYQHKEPEPVVVGKAPESLPALHIEVTGMVTASNLEEFKGQALAVIGGINKDLQTDADFADAEKTVKWLGDVESRLDAAKEHALSQTASIDQLFKALDDIKAESRQTRLDLGKLVKARKEARRGEIRQEAVDAYRAHIDALNIRLERVKLPEIPADFAGAMKNKRTIESLKDAVSTELARVKIESNQVADRVEANLKMVDKYGEDYTFLFSDIQQLAAKDPGDLADLIKARINNHQAEEKRKEEEQRERIRREEEAKAQREADARAEQERQRIRAEEAERARPEREAQTRPDPQNEPAPEPDLPPAAQEKPRVRQQPATQRPTDAQIVNTLAAAYRVDSATVVKWLSEMRLSSAA